MIMHSSLETETSLLYPDDWLLQGTMHDLRNNLLQMKLIVNLMQKDPEMVSEYISFLDETVDSSVALLNSLGKKGASSLQKKHVFSLNDMLSSYRKNKSLLQDSNIEVTTDICEHPCLIEGYPLELNNAFLNMLFNAIQAMEDGGKLTISLARNHCDNTSITKITDTGRGMSPDQLDRTFNFYYTTRKDGTGLGLPMVLRAVRLHGGNIKVESTPNVGTTFTIYLPCVTPQEEE